MSSKVSTRGTSRLYYGAVCALLLAYPVFGQLLPTWVGVLTFGIALSLVFYGRLGQGHAGEWRLDIGVLLWLALGVLAAVSHIVSATEFSVAVPILFASIMILALGVQSHEWLHTSLSVARAFVLVHVAATVVFYLYPPAYTTIISGRFFTDSTFAVDYRAALTANPGYNAMFCALAFLLVAVPLVLRKVERGPRLLWVAVSAASLFALVITEKRAHPLFVLLSLLFLYLLTNRSSKWLYLLGTGVVGLLLVDWFAGFSEAVDRSLSRFMGTFESTDFGDATSGRTFLWEHAVEGWRERPLLGHGWDSFYVVWPNNRTESFIAHNQLLNSMYELGTVGLLLFVLASLYSLLRAYRSFSALRDSGSTSAYYQGSAASLSIQTFMLLYSCTGGELLSKPYTFVPYLMAIAWAYASARHCDDSSQSLSVEGIHGSRRRVL